jgi:hypothetical protein
MTRDDNLRDFMSREKPEADPTRMADRASDSFVMVKGFNFNGSVVGFVVVGSVVGRRSSISADLARCADVRRRCDDG